VLLLSEKELKREKRLLEESQVKLKADMCRLLTDMRTLSFQV
jgi:hypothetical protein